MAGLPSRNTPTGVGKTPCWRARKARCRKHPHGRGEDNTSPSGIPPYKETPPRAWGRRSDQYLARRLHGNTPTGVGKTWPPHPHGHLWWKHPHGRGEDSAASACSAISAETPPRAWGRHNSGNEHIAYLGNTPTGVGKTPASRLPDAGLEKHPHGRGEDVFAPL